VEPEQVRLAQVTWNFPSPLVKKPHAGRFFFPQEQGKMATPVILLSDELWRRRFGADPRVIGQSVRLNGQPRTIVGVMPHDFRIVFPEGSSVPPEMDAFIPFPSDLAKGTPDRRDIFRVIVREGMAPVIAGVFAGLVLSLLLTPLIASLLFGVHPADFGTFLTSSIFLAGVGLLACYFPARRAIRVDPLVALRYE
jgi:MacB-like periplasmic core domain